MIKQISAITLMNLRNLPQRIASSWVIVISIAVMVAVMVSVLAMAEGFTQALEGAARADRAIVLRAGSQAEMSSTLDRGDTQTIMDTPGVRQDADGKPMASANVVTLVTLQQKSNGADANVTLRGVGPNAMAARPEIRLLAGRMFQPAVHELIAGRAAMAQFKGLELGSSIAIHDSEWSVVGSFESHGSQDVHESELLGDSETVLSAYHRNMFQSVSVLLKSPEAFDQFKNALTSNPILKVTVKRETEYYAEQAQSLGKLLHVLAYFVGGIMALGACFAALNTMYSAVSSRTQEVATLRAMGFSNIPIVISVLLESILLSLVGSVLGSAAAWAGFNGDTVNTLGGHFSQVVFHLTVNASALATGVFMAGAIGVLGGLFPALQAIKLPIATAFRAN